MNDRPVVFDIGGTWFRSAVYGPQGLEAHERRPAVSFHRHPESSVDELQQQLLDWLHGEVLRLQRQHAAGSRAVISMGAALNAHTGQVFGSGPLWGPGSRPFDLPGALRQRAPEISWLVLNDVTAALLRHVHAAGQRSHGRTALVTLSSGIACRVFDHARGCVPVDPGTGLQGEIGHLPVRCTFAGQVVELDCDCGGRNHLAAFASGRGLAAMLAHVAALPEWGIGRSVLAGTQPTVGQLVGAACAGDPWCRAVIVAAMEPLASVLAVMLTHDPELDPVLFTGGLTGSLGQHLINVLCSHLEAQGLYGITAQQPRFFRDRLRLGFLDDDSGLLGCGIAAAAPWGTEAMA